MNGTDYISERVINIAELESLIRSAYYDIAALRKELEKENPSMGKIDELSKQVHLALLQAKDFEFCVERRKTKCLSEVTEVFDINATVHLSGADDAAKTAGDLIEKLNEAKTILNELASLIEKLEVKVKM